MGDGCFKHPAASNNSFSPALNYIKYKLNTSKI